MKSLKLYITILSIISITILGSCHKHNHAGNVTIEIESPTEGMILISGDSLDIHIHYTSDDMIHNVEVKVVNETNNNEIVYSFDEHVHAENSYSFEDKIPLTVTENSMFHIETIVSGHGFNDDLFTEKVNFEVQMP